MEKVAPRKGSDSPEITQLARSLAKADKYARPGTDLKVNVCFLSQFYSGLESPCVFHFMEKYKSVIN